MTTDIDGAETGWRPRISKADGPLYLAIADALAADILSGRLTGGARLPAQRALAETLGVDFTTVGRAYAEARKRGLIEGKVGQGTYVRSRRPTPSRARADGLIDMSMNLPPRFDHPAVAQAMFESIASLRDAGGLDLLMRYQEPGGTLRDKEAGASWLSGRVDLPSTDRVLVCAGAQGALHAVLASLASPGDRVCSESLTYPGFLSIAAHLRLETSRVEMDEHGLLPASFEQACRERRPKALYCTPTLHNPTTRTLPLDRRLELIRVARNFHVPIIEDDAYGALAVSAPPPLAALAPDLVYHIASLSKCLAPAVRVAYLVTPDERTASRIAGAIRATASMVSPLTGAIATRWIEDGTAEAVLTAIKSETKARQALARKILPPQFEAEDGAFHLWLRVERPWTRGELVARLRVAGVGVVASDAFAIGDAPEAVRIGLGVPATLDDVEQSLKGVADFLGQTPAISTMVV